MPTSRTCPAIRLSMGIRGVTPAAFPQPGQNFAESESLEPQRWQNMLILLVCNCRIPQCAGGGSRKVEGFLKWQARTERRQAPSRLRDQRTHSKRRCDQRIVFFNQILRVSPGAI